MYRILTIFFIILATGLASCASERDTDRTSDTQPADQNGTADGTITQPTGTGTDTFREMRPDEEAGRQAQEMMRSGNIEGAIFILENMSAQSPLSESMNLVLVEAHLAFAKEVAEKQDVDDAVLHEILFTHYMRVLQLDPANEVAMSRLDEIRQWYIDNGLRPPETINPLKFIHAPQDEVTADESEEIDPVEETVGE
ncbi:MAG TPA: hypothetical protein ENN67_06680 [Firmicutes bacterium]|nr:hypothetical protein [Bacillota bacterium]